MELLLSSKAKVSAKTKFDGPWDGEFMSKYGPER